MMHARSHQVAKDTLLYRTELAEQVQGAGCKMHVFRCPVAPPASRCLSVLGETAVCAEQASKAGDILHVHIIK